MTINSLVAAGNTYNPCLLILRAKGFRVWAEEEHGKLFWNAEKEGLGMLAYSPPELLGIVTLWETMGENWNQQQPDIIGEVLRTSKANRLSRDVGPFYA